MCFTHLITTSRLLLSRHLPFQTLLYEFRTQASSYLASRRNVLSCTQLDLSVTMLILWTKICSSWMFQSLLKTWMYSRNFSPKHTSTTTIKVSLHKYQNHRTSKSWDLHIKVWSQKNLNHLVLISIWLSPSSMHVTWRMPICHSTSITECCWFYQPIAFVWDYAWLLSLKIIWLKLRLPPPYLVKGEEESSRVCNQFLMVIVSIFCSGWLPTVNHYMKDDKTWKLPNFARL